MSSAESWLRVQIPEVASDGAAVAVITLEGPDGTTWGTWRPSKQSRAEADRIAGEVGQHLELLAAELPNGKHKAKLLAHDSAAQQLAVLPLTIAGKSSAAAAASTEALGMQRAVAMAVQNFDAITGGLRHENERLRERNDELLDNLSTVLAKQLETQIAIAGILQDEKREEMRAKRLDDIWISVKPLAEALMDVVGAEVGQRYEAAKAAREAEAARKKGLNGAPPPAQSTAPAGSAAPNDAGGKPPDPSGGGSDRATEGAPTDGGASAPGIDGVRSAGAGGPDPVGATPPATADPLTAESNPRRRVIRRKTQPSSSTARKAKR